MPGGVTYKFFSNDTETGGTPALARKFTGGLIVEGVGGGLADLNGHVTFGCGGFLDGLGPSYKINCQTVAAGSTTVTAVTHAHAGRQTCDGRWSVMTGLDLQAGGFPMNTFYFDYCVPTARDTGTGEITLSAPLKYSYKSTWPLSYDGQDEITQSFGGPAMLYPLVPEWNTSVHYINCNFSGNAGGQAFNCEIREAIFEGCGTTNHDGINISQIYLCWFKGGDISGASQWEIDKMVNTIVIDGTTMVQPTVQSSSIERLIVANGATITNLNGAPKELVLTSDSTISVLNLGVAYGAPEVFHWAGTAPSITANVGGGYANIDSLTTITAGVITSPFGADVQRWPVPGHTYFLKDTGTGYWRIPFRVIDISQTGTAPNGTIQITTNLTTMTGWPSWGSAIDVVPHPCPQLYRYNYVSEVTWPNGEPIYSYSKRFFSTYAGTYTGAAHVWENFGYPPDYNYTATMLGKVESISVNVQTAYGGVEALVWNWPSAFGNYSVTRPNFSVTTWAPSFDLTTPGERIMRGGQAPIGKQPDDGILNFPGTGVGEDVWMTGSAGAAANFNFRSIVTFTDVTVEISMDHDVVPQNVAMTDFEREQLADVFTAIPRALYLLSVSNRTRPCLSLDRDSRQHISRCLNGSCNFQYCQSSR